MRIARGHDMANRTIVRVLAAAAAVAIAATGCSGQPTAPPTPPATVKAGPAPVPEPKRCPVTVANGNGPPGEQPSSLNHGNGRLWTVLPPDGVDRGGTPEPDGSTGQKYPWWTVGTSGGLSIKGRRLDAAVATPLRTRVDSGVPMTPFAKVPGGRFWSSGIYFPTEGCWQVTGRVGAISLTFVVLMAN